MPSWFPFIASTLLAVIPVGIWIRIISRLGEEKGLLIKTFLLGTFSVIPPFILIFLFDRYPQLNVYLLISREVGAFALAALLTNLVVGIIEEIGKHLIVRVIDKRHPEYLQTISSALRLSICAGLGFSFAENIFYFYSITTNPSYGASDLFTTFIFRSIFTMCGHMIFSGIFGYFFGIGKFAPDVSEQARWEGDPLRFARFFSRITGRMVYQVVREQKILTGLFLAMVMHAAFNVSLDLGHKLPAIGIVAAGALYIFYLLRTKSGHLMFSILKRRDSSMSPKDEEVVLELLGMALKEGRLQEVIQMCDRLLLRDPDNNVVKLFKAKAADNEKLRQVYYSIKNYLSKTRAPQSLPESQLTPKSAALKSTGVSMSVTNEKLVLEVMDMWYREGNYDQVLNVANRLLERNPSSEGAKLLLQKSLDKGKLENIFNSLSKLFEE